MFTKDDNQIYKSYLGILLEQKQEEVKQQFAQQLQKPEAQQAMLKQAQELYSKKQKDYAAALEQDGGKPGANVEKFYVEIQKQLNAAAKQQINDSVEIQEGLIGRTASLASGAVKKFGDVMSGKNTTTSFRQEAILKHFEKLKNNLGSSLRELQRDMATTSGTDTKVRDFVNQTIANIESQHNIAPTQSKLSDFRHKAGQVVKNIATGTIFAIPVMAVATPIAAAMGLTGAAAAAVAAGLTGGSVSMLKDMFNGQKPDGKRAIITGLGAAVSAGLASKFFPHAQVDAPPADVPTDTVPHSDVHDMNVGKEIADFDNQHGGPYDHGSELDQAKADMRGSMRDVGLSDHGSTFGAKTVMKDFTDELGKHARQLGVPHDQMKDIVADVTKNLTTDQLAQLSDDNALRTGKVITKFAEILADKHPELSHNKLMDVAQQTLSKYRDLKK